MTNRFRKNRRRTERSPGVLRRTSPQSIQERQSKEESERGEGFTRWRVVSLLILVVFAMILGMIFTADLFYVRSVQVRGLDYLTTEEVFAFADVANVHLFWLDPDVIQANLLRTASIAEAEVELRWPPEMVYIEVEERQPAVIWAESGSEMWVDLQGRMMTARTPILGLMRINAAIGAFDQPLTDRQHLDEDIVFGALQMQELLPQVTSLNYDPVNGLGWTNNDGWQIWMGSGTGMAEKVRIYQTLAQNLIARGIQPGELNISNPDAPFYTVLWGR